MVSRALVVLAFTLLPACASSSADIRSTAPIWTRTLHGHAELIALCAADAFEAQLQDDGLGPIMFQTRYNPQTKIARLTAINAFMEFPWIPRLNVLTDISFEQSDAFSVLVHIRSPSWQSDRIMPQLSRMIETCAVPLKSTP